MWPGQMWGVGWGGMIIGGILMLLFWGAVIAVVVLAVRALSGRDGERMPSFRSARDEALEILKARYARGEIDREQYLEMRRDLDA